MSATTPFASISSKRRRPSAHCPLRVHALIATAYVTELRGTPATSMYVKSVIALSSCIPSAHALIAPVYVTVFRSTPDASIARKSTSARCHSPAFAHAAIAELNEIVVGSTPHARISSKISSAASTPAARDAAEIAELNETASHTAPLREWWVAGGEPRAAGAVGGRRAGGRRAAPALHLAKDGEGAARRRAGARRDEQVVLEGREPQRRLLLVRPLRQVGRDAPLPLALQVEQQRREVALDDVLAGEDLADVVGGRARRQPH